MRDSVIDFSVARAAIAALLEEIPERDRITDLHVQSGAATIRLDGACRAVDLGRLDLNHAVANIAALTTTATGRELSVRSPILEQRIPPWFRVTCTHPSLVWDGSWAMSLRLLPPEAMPLERWVEDGYLAREDYGRLLDLMTRPTTVLVSGTMGAGKTRLLGSLIAEIPIEQRLVVVEDAAELSITRENTLLLSATPYAELGRIIAHSFRHDAVRVIVGEIRDASALEFLTLASGGVRAITTIHADPGVGGLKRLHWLAQQSGAHVTMEQIEAAVHAVVTVTRAPDGRRSVDVLG